jgi:hypothetical protein
MAFVFGFWEQAQEHEKNLSVIAGLLSTTLMSATAQHKRRSHSKTLQSRYRNNKKQHQLYINTRP